MDSVDLTQSLIVALSKMLITPVVKSGDFTKYFRKVMKSHNLISSVGAGASDMISQIAMDSSVLQLEKYIGYQFNTVHLGQAALTGGVYVLGDYLLQRTGIYRSPRLDYYLNSKRGFDFKERHVTRLTDFVYVTLLDSLAQVATPKISPLYSVNNQIRNSNVSKIEYTPMMTNNVANNTPKAKIRSNQPHGKKNKNQSTIRA